MENQNQLKNPVVQEVVDRFDSIRQRTKLFIKSSGAINGLLISGNAGVGKTHFVKKAFIENNALENVVYVKGSTLTAPALFMKLWETREKGKILVLDDTDLIHRGKSEVAIILDLLKGATEPTKGERQLSWLRGAKNALFKDNDVPETFDFQGSVIWITNESISSLEKGCGSHWNAISSRFNQVPVWLDDKEKVLYTLYLIEEIGLLGKDCEALEGGYKLEVVTTTAEYIRQNWKRMDDVTPRVAIKIADLVQEFPENEEWRRYLEIGQ